MFVCKNFILLIELKIQMLDDDVLLGGPRNSQQPPFFNNKSFWNIMSLVSPKCLRISNAEEGAPY